MAQMSDISSRFSKSFNNPKLMGLLNTPTIPALVIAYLNAKLSSSAVQQNILGCSTCASLHMRMIVLATTVPNICGIF